jgi:KUP system potassium uptake protein
MPILLGAFLVLTMLVWHQGRRLVARTYLSRYPKLGDAWAVLSKRIVTRTPGVSVFMASADEGVPPFLVHHVERTRALQQRVLLLTVVTKDVPRVELKDRLEIRELEHGFVRVHVYFGYFEEPDIPRALRLAVARRELDLELSEVTYYLARERILGNPGGQMNWVLERFFGYLSRNAVNADRHFRIPHGQVIEVGVQLDL